MKTALPILTALALCVTASTALAAEYYRWQDENGVVHITDNLHNVPPKHRPKVNRLATPERPPAPPEPEMKLAPTTRKASIPIEKHGHVVVIEATLNNKRSAKFVVDTGASYTLIGAIVLLGGIGYGVDQWRGTAPWGLFVGLSLGLIVGFYKLAKIVWHR